MTPPQLARFEAKIHVEPNTGCWLWIGATICGYGAVGMDRRVYYAHRVSYEHHVGPIASGMVIDHLCRQPACVRPDHLEQVTQYENVMRGSLPEVSRKRQLSKTHCPRGHAYTQENTIVLRASETRGVARRLCRTCNRDNCKKFRTAMHIDGQESDL